MKSKQTEIDNVNAVDEVLDGIEEYQTVEDWEGFVDCIEDVVSRNLYYRVASHRFDGNQMVEYRRCQ